MDTVKGLSSFYQYYVTLLATLSLQPSFQLFLLAIIFTISCHFIYTVMFVQCWYLFIRIMSMRIIAFDLVVLSFWIVVGPR